MNKIIKINDTKTNRYYASTDKTYEVTKRELVYECEECSKEVSVTIKTSTAGNKGSIEYYLNKPCKNCGKRLLAMEHLLEKAVQKFPNEEFDYSLITKSNFVNGFTTVPIICNVHDLEFNTTLNNHTAKPAGVNHPNNGGCPQCAKESHQEAESYKVSDWREIVNTKFPHIKLTTSINDNTILSCHTEVSFDCAYHGEFKAKCRTLRKVVYLCPLCVQENNSWGGRFRRTDIAGTVYFIYIPVLKVWKLGVTKMTVEERQASIPFEYEVVWSVEFPTLKAAYAEETRLFREYKDHRLKGVPKGLLGKAKGITELLNCSIPIDKVGLSQE